MEYCFKEQNYKKMKANHNLPCGDVFSPKTVSKSKITKKWKPITTPAWQGTSSIKLFQRAKLQKNESQSQHHTSKQTRFPYCFKEQNYKKMKANHNLPLYVKSSWSTVSKSKITKKWKPITTACTALYF